MRPWIIVTIIIGIIFVLACLYYGFFIEVNSLRKEELVLPLKELPELWLDKKIIVFSDIHLGKGMSKARLANFIQQMSEQEPDLVLFAGDLSEDAHKISEDDYQAYVTLWSELRPSIGSFAVYGNHDVRTKAGKQFADRFYNDVGIVVLENSGLVIDGLALLGLAESMHSKPDFDKAWHDLLETEDESKLKAGLVLLHQPDPAGQMAQNLNIGLPLLFLSGHSHGGQINPFGLHLYREVQGSEYPDGYYDFDNGNSLFTSIGLGTVRIHARFLAPPSYTVITFE